MLTSSMSLEFQRFLQRIAGRRTSQTAGCRRAFYIASIQIGGENDPGRSLRELIPRELTIFDQTTHGRRTNGQCSRGFVERDLAAFPALALPISAIAL